MAALNKIRSKAGLLVVVIGVALLAFIVGDFLNSGQSFSLLQKNKVASVNGVDIAPEEFRNRAEAQVEQVEQYYKNVNVDVPIGEADRVRQMVYNQMVSEILLDQEYEKLGITVSDEELADLFRGENPHELVVQQFGDPQTGKVDVQRLDEYVRMLYHPEEFGYTAKEDLDQFEIMRQGWVQFEESVRQARKQEKLNTLLNKTITPNKLDLEAVAAEKNTMANVAYVLQPYSEVADDEITVTEAELQDAYEKYKESFKTREMRVVKYISVDVLPSEEDRQALEQEMNALAPQFASATNVEQFLLDNSDKLTPLVYRPMTYFSGKEKAFVDSAAVGDVSTLDFANNTYTLYRLVDTKTAPASIEARYVSFNLNEANVDSLFNVVKTANDDNTFDAVAKEVNKSVNKRTFTEDMALSGDITKVLLDNIFASTEDYFTVKTYDKEYIVQVTSRGEEVEKAQVATLEKELVPSHETNTKYYNELSAYAATNNKAKDFVAAAKDTEYEVKEAICSAEMIMLAENGTSNEIPGTRSVISWAFGDKTKKGQVSENIFTIGNDNNITYVVAALEDVIKEGYMPFKYAQEDLTTKVRFDKKAEKMIADLEAKKLTGLDGYAQALNTKVDTTQTVFSNPMMDVLAIAPSVENGKLVGPVKGGSGVYVFQVIDKVESQQPYNKDAWDIQAVNQQVFQSLGVNPYMISTLSPQQKQAMVNLQINKVLTDKAKIKNTSYRFF